MMDDLTELQNGTIEVQERIDKVQGQIEDMANRRFDTYKVVTYKIQQLEGAKVYYVKVFIGGDDNCIHAKVTQPLEGNEFAEEIREPKNFLSPIEEF